MLETVSLACSYVLLNAAGVTVMYLLLGKVFPRRGAPILWYAYFLSKATIDATLWYPGGHSMLPGWVTSLATVWTGLSGIISFVVICLSFHGDYILKSTCAVLCDPLVSGMTAAGMLLANATCGTGTHEGFFIPPWPHMVIALAVLVILYRLVRIHIVHLLRLVCRSVLCHRFVWGACAVVMALMFTLASRKAVNFASLEMGLSIDVSALVIFLAVIGTAALRQVQQLRRRRKTLQDCLAISERYDSVVREQLAQLEQDHVALEGHEEVLQRLRTGKDDLTAERISQLEQTYQDISMGSFCEQPALDAVLLAAQRRLSEAEIDSTITVAGVPSSVSVPVMVVLSMANLTCEAAQRAFDRDDNHVNLRIRGIGNQVLVHLDVPAIWGTLWVDRYLPMLDSHDTGLIRERTEGARRVVTVLCEGVSA